MYSFAAVLLALLIARGGWGLLKRTRLPRAARLLTALLIGGAAAALLYWGMLYLSILAFQINDPVTW